MMDQHPVIIDTTALVVGQDTYIFEFECHDQTWIKLELPGCAAGDDRALRLWLNDRRSVKTQRSYAREIARFYQIVQLPLVQVKLDHLQSFMRDEQIASLKTSSQSRALAAVKSLLTFASRAVVEVLPVNVGAAMSLPRVEDTLAERIMSEQSADDMIRMEPDPRNQAMLELLYFAALRVEELCNLKWRHLQDRDQAGQIAVFGKGQHTRFILLDSDTWAKVWALRKDSKHNGLDDYVFTSRQAKFKKDEQGQKVRTEDYRLDPRRVHQIVRAAADRAGVAVGKVSPHWLRHAHATHALDAGEPISLVSATLGHKSVAVTSRYLHVRPNASSALGLRKAQKERMKQK